MLNYAQIKEYFDPGLVIINPKGVLVEYLQYEFLDSLFKLPGTEHLSFMGGTAVRIIYNSHRFSEDLDFDNFGLSDAEFKIIMDKTCGEMSVKGFKLEKRFSVKDKTSHCYVKFPEILFQLGISSHREEKIFLGVDAERKKKLFTPDIKTLNKFGVFRRVAVNPPAVLLAQKMLAILLRRRAKGRDFYDASFLAGLTGPDYAYLASAEKLNRAAFIQRLEKHCANLNFKALAKDVEPFLFDSGERERVLHFKEHLRDITGSESQ